MHRPHNFEGGFPPHGFGGYPPHGFGGYPGMGNNVNVNNIVSGNEFLNLPSNANLK